MYTYIGIDIFARDYRFSISIISVIRFISVISVISILPFGGASYKNEQDGLKKTQRRGLG